MAARLTITSDDDLVATLTKLHWSLVPEFLLLNGRGSKNRLRNYSLVLSEAEMVHIEKLCGPKVLPRKPQKTVRKVSKSDGRTRKKVSLLSPKKTAQSGRLF